MNQICTTILLSAILLLVQLSEAVSSGSGRSLHHKASTTRKVALRGHNIEDRGSGNNFDDYDDAFDYEDDDELFYEDGPEELDFEEDDYEDYDDDYQPTASCNLPESVHAVIVGRCSETEYRSTTWPFTLKSPTYCDDGAYIKEVKNNVSNADDCAQTCIEIHDAKEMSANDVVGFWYGCDGKCVCLIDNQATDSVSNNSTANEGNGGCYKKFLPLGVAIYDPEGIDDDAFRC